jgi:hypothetical protein
MRFFPVFSLELLSISIIFLKIYPSLNFQDFGEGARERHCTRRET